MLSQSRASYWADWWEAHESYAFTVLAALLFGSLLGALALEAVDGATRVMLLLLVKRFLNIEAARIPGAGPIFGAAFMQNVKVLGLLYVLGVSVAGLPLVLLAVLFRGFVLGFAVGFFLETLHGPCLVLALIAVALPNAAILPAWLAVGAGGLRFSWRLLVHGDVQRHRLGAEFYQMTAAALLALGPVLVGSALEAAVAPALLHWLAPWGL